MDSYSTCEHPGAAAGALYMYLYMLWVDQSGSPIHLCQTPRLAAGQAPPQLRPQSQPATVPAGRPAWTPLGGRISRHLTPRPTPRPTPPPQVSENATIFVVAVSQKTPITEPDLDFLQVLQKALLTIANAMHKYP